MSNLRQVVLEGENNVLLKEVGERAKREGRELVEKSETFAVIGIKGGKSGREVVVCSSVQEQILLVSCVVGMLRKLREDLRDNLGGGGRGE